MVILKSKRFLYSGFLALLFCITAALPQVAYAQEKGESRYEKMQKEKIKRNRRRIKSDRAKSNKQQLRFLKFQTNSRQGDRPYGKDGNGKRYRKRIPSSSSPAVYAQPDPYSFRSGSRRRRNVYSNESLKISPRPAAKAWKGDRGKRRVSPQSEGRINVFPQPNPYSYSGQGRRARKVYSNDNQKRYPQGGREGNFNLFPQPDPYSYSKNRREKRVFSNEQQRRYPQGGRGGNINVFAQPDPYSHRKKRDEGDRISKNQDSYGTSPRDPERPSKRKRVRPSSASARYFVRKRSNPYKLRGRDKWEETYTGGFYGRRGDISPRDNQKTSEIQNSDPYADRSRMGDTPYSGEISGNVFSRPRDNQRAWKGDIAGKKIRSTSQRSARVNVFPQVNPYGKRLNRTESDRMSKNQDFYGSSPRDTERPTGRKKIKIQSASGRYIVNRKAKPYKIRDVKKWEETYTGGFYGRRGDIQPMNTQRVSSFESPNPYEKRGRMGDKPYSGVISGGGLMSATKRGEQAWQGDIAGRRIERNVPHSTQRSGDRFGRRAHAGSISGGNHNNQGRAITQGGGGSISSNMKRDNSGKAILSFTPESREQGFYQGNIKAGKPLRGGGSMQRKDWNNRGQALPQRYNDESARAVGTFSGSLRRGKPFKGGGSMSGELWNNNETPLPRANYSDNARTPGSFGGTIKISRPEKGGGSLARNDWNNKGQALPKRYIGGDITIAGSFSGNQKAYKPEKGGGSISREGAWNNDGASVSVKKLTPAGYYASRYQGDVKYKGGYSRSDDANKHAIKSRKPSKAYFAGAGFQGNSRKSNRKPDGQLHASTKFYSAKAEENSVEEKNKIFSFKLLWNKLFGKDVPEKDNIRKPRYDKGEKDLWNE